MQKLFKLSSNLFILQELFTKTFLVLFFGFTNCFILLISTPLMFVIKAILGIAHYTDEQGKIYCEHLADLYKQLYSKDEVLDVKIKSNF